MGRRRLEVHRDTEYLDQSGHEVTWQLDWDTSQVSGVATLDTVIRAMAVDKRALTAGIHTNASSETENAAPDVTANNVRAIRWMWCRMSALSPLPTETPVV